MEKLKGLFLNTWKANCSIYESGKMAYNALLFSDKYLLDYKEINEENREISTNYDFFIFNYHQTTMGWLDTTCVKQLSGLKATIVLEVLPQDPFVMCPKYDFDAYIVLDPTIDLPDSRVYAFPRPLEKAPLLEPYIEPEIPIIGTFGFATPGKGFEFVVDAVNKEFERAIIKINIPIATHALGNYEEKVRTAQKMGEKAKAVAKSGIEVIVTHDYMEKDDLIRWCSKNTLNCFLYNRNQPGLAATTDQAIVSGRPLAVSANETFRHIHQYLVPYPFQSLKDSLNNSQIGVRKMQDSWSSQETSKSFEKVLEDFHINFKKKSSNKENFSLKSLVSFKKIFFFKKVLRKIAQKSIEELVLLFKFKLSGANFPLQPPTPPRPYVHHIISSHSQYGEDLILDLIFRGKHKGFYVDVGANHPEYGSNTNRFYLRGWSGINIEPNPECFNKIKRHRENDINLNIAIAKEKRKLKFYNFPNDSTLSSLDLETAERMARTLNLSFSEVIVDTLPLNDVFEKYALNKKIDFLTVDAEGYDIEVLRSNNWLKWRPSIVMVEVFQQQKEVVQYMHNIGYLHIFSNQVNSIFIDNTTADNDLNHVWNRKKSESYYE